MLLYGLLLIALGRTARPVLLARRTIAVTGGKPYSNETLRQSIAARICSDSAVMAESRATRQPSRRGLDKCTGWLRALQGLGWMQQHPGHCAWMVGTQARMVGQQRAEAHQSFVFSTAHPTQFPTCCCKLPAAGPGCPE